MIDKFAIALRNKQHFIRFLLVGVSGLLVNNLLMAGFTEMASYHYLLSAALATQGSTLWNFTLTEGWVFQEKENKQPFSFRIGSYFLMNNFFLILRGPLLTILISGLGIHYLVSNVVSIVIVTLLRFLIAERWIWSKKGESVLKDSFRYDIHGVVRVESEVALPELEYFLTIPPHGQEFDATDIRLRIQPRKTLQKDKETIRYDEGIGDLGFWVDIQQGEITEVVASPMLKRSPHVLYTNVIEPLLRWTFVHKGYALIHGACLSHNGKAVLVTAQTDTGKTTTILRALSHYHFSFLSDDMTILGSSGCLLSYPKPLTISLHTLQAVEGSTLTTKERIALQFQSRLHSRMGRRLGMLLSRFRLPAATLNAFVQMLVPPPKYRIERLIPDVDSSKSASLAHVMIIKRGPASERTLHDELAVELLVKNAEDAYGFPPYPALAPQLSRWNGEDLHYREMKIIQQALSKVPVVQLQSPDYNWWRRISTLFFGEVSGREKRRKTSRIPTSPRGYLPLESG